MSPQRKKTDKSSNSKIKQNKKQSKITQRMKTEVPIQMHNNLKKSYE